MCYQLTVGLMALVLQTSSDVFGGASARRAAVGTPLQQSPITAQSFSRVTCAVMLAADDAERQHKRAVDVSMRLEETVECDAEYVAEAIQVEDCIVRTAIQPRPICLQLLVARPLH